jgi:hypothetical protein
MKLIHEERLIDSGEFSTSSEWKKIYTDLCSSIKAVDWPLGSGTFSIYPESGKLRGKGNGVKPIKNRFIENLVLKGWQPEIAINFQEGFQTGRMDAVKVTDYGHFVVEWETGNISSSHRSLNKMALGLLKGKLIGGTLIVPSRALYYYLTDRIGNFNELQPYVDLWKNVKCRDGILTIFVVEYDSLSEKVPRIPKGTSGRALE